MLSSKYYESFGIHKNPFFSNFDKPTDQRTASYRDARAHLKKIDVKNISIDIMLPNRTYMAFKYNND